LKGMYEDEELDLEVIGKEVNDAVYYVLLA
jgi:hypothetical protein